MSQLQLNRVSKEIIDQAEKSLISEQDLPRAVDDYFIQLVKREEMEHAAVDPRLYDGLRQAVRGEVLPLYEQYRRETARVRQHKQGRKLWQYVLGTVASLEILQALVTKGRSMAPQVFIPTAILHSFLGFIIFAGAQYIEDLQLARARRRLERSLEHLDSKAVTDAEYDQRRELQDNQVLRAEALELLTHYERPEEFWQDYRKVRQSDPTLPAEVRALGIPAFEKFLKFHAEGQFSSVAREHRFNQLFLAAHELFISRNRSRYVLDHLDRKATNPS
jgi:hypothetical protein